MSEAILTRGFVAAQVGEALANYALSDRPLEDRAGLAGRELRSKDFSGTFYDDGSFWSQLFEKHVPGTVAMSRPALKFGIDRAALSEWVPRVPGLYWQPGSSKMRKINPAQVENKTQRWITYVPLGKSTQVSGGVGTLRFPPTEDGFRLVTLTTTLNASAGVPALISPDVWDHHDLSEGAIVNGQANWREMPERWAVQFPAIQGIPRGCLILDGPGSITRTDGSAPILAHPFSVMEYWDGNAQLHDFVYSEADTSSGDFRGRLEDFFEYYRKARGREGSYLVAADISHPMWEAEFTDPGEMRGRKAAQLRLIQARVREAANGEDVVEALVRKLSSLQDTGDLKRLSSKADIEWRRWSEGGRLVDEAARLVDAAIKSGKQQALLQAVQMELAL